MVTDKRDQVRPVHTLLPNTFIGCGLATTVDRAG